MKKLLYFLLLIILFPMIVWADTSESSSEVKETAEEVIESPDTGVNDYFLVLGCITICISAGLYIINKKQIFQNY